MIRIARPVLVAAAMALAAGCGKSATAPQVRDITGSYSGTTTTGYTFNFTMVDSAQILHGTGSVLAGTTTITSLTVVGSHDHPYFHVSFTFAGTFVPVSFDGNDSTTTSLVGVLTGSGFTGEQLIEHKQ